MFHSILTFFIILQARNPGWPKNRLQGARKRPSLPELLLHRRLYQERLEKEKAIEEMETMQKRMDEMQAQLDLAHSKVGDVVSVASPITTSASKVRLKLL